MLENFLFQIVMPFLVNPADPKQEEAYTSGLKGDKNFYLEDLSTDYPSITFDTLAYDSEFNYIEPGIYAVDFTLETKQLLLLQGQQIKAKCPVIQIIRLNDEQGVSVPTAEIVLHKNNKVFIIYKKKNLEVHGFLYKAGSLPD